MPVSQIQRLCLGLVQDGKLLLSPFGRKDARLQVLAAQNLIDALQPATLEPQRHGHPQ